MRSRARAATPPAVAERMPHGSGSELVDAAGRAFVEAMSIGLVAAGAASLIGAVVVWLRLPARHDDALESTAASGPFPAAQPAAA